MFSPELKEGVIQFNREKDSDVVEAGSKQDDSEHHQFPTFKMWEDWKDSFWILLGTMVAKTPQAEETWIEADLNGRVREGDGGALQVVEKYEEWETNLVTG